jgi:hypothetical protein
VVEEQGRRIALTAGQGARTFSSQPPVQASDEALQALFDRFARLRAETFVRTAPSGPPVRTLTGAGHTVTLYAGAPCRGRANGLDFTLTPGDCRALLAPLPRATRP